jgi:fumarate hydratase subunit alpha
MRKISTKLITRAVEELCIQANTSLGPDVLKSIKTAIRTEKNRLSREFLEAILENARFAEKERIPVCQDTGLVVVFVSLGQEVRITGENLNKAINAGINRGYKKGYLRSSIVKDPIRRRGPAGNIPGVIHLSLVPGDKMKLSILPRGFGSENKARLKMFEPTADLGEIKRFIIETVREAGPDACPPFVVGVGIGGSQDKAAILAKEALLRPLSKHHLRVGIAKLERELLSAINRLQIGPMGLGGKTTALAVNIETYPTHIAGLPVAVDISCHALRSATRII